MPQCDLPKKLNQLFFKNMSSIPPNGWDITRLRIFLHVAQAGSLTRAGASLGLPQSATSKHISRLEAECGGRLFYRTGRGMMLTELGARLLPKVQSILRGVDELSVEIAENAADPRGDVRVGALPSLYSRLIVPLFSQLRALHPHIRLQVFEGSAGQIDQWLINGYVDIGLPYRYNNQAPIDAEPLMNIESYLVGKPGSPILRKQQIPFAQLHDVPLVLPGAPSGVRLLLDQIARQQQIRLNVVLEADSTQIQHTVAATGEAFTILPRHAVEAEVNAGRLKLSKITDPVIERSIAIGMTSMRPMSTAAKIVARMIRSHFSAQKLA